MKSDAHDCMNINDITIYDKSQKQIVINRKQWKWVAKGEGESDDDDNDAAAAAAAAAAADGDDRAVPRISLF